MASLAHLSVASADSEGTIGDKEVEELLSQKLLEGFTLLDTACPNCVTPLVKKNATSMALSPRKQLPFCATKETSPHLSVSVVTVQLQPSDSNVEHQFSPVSNVPFCVSCQAHVVLREADIAALEEINSMKDQGRIIVAIEEEEREELNCASPSRLAARNIFCSESAERDSPEEESDKENCDEEEPFQEIVEEKQVLHPVEAPVDEEPVVEAVVEEESDLEPEDPLAQGEGAEEDKPALETEDPFLQDEDDEEERSVVDNSTLAKPVQVQPAMAAFLCASTASYQYVVPTPAHTPKYGMSFVEEEGIEHDLDELTRCMEKVGSEAAFSAILPPKPMESDLLAPDEKEELEQERLALSPRLEQKSTTKSKEDEDAVDIILQEYSVR